MMHKSKPTRIYRAFLRLVKVKEDLQWKRRRGAVVYTKVMLKVKANLEHLIPQAE